MCGKKKFDNFPSYSQIENESNKKVLAFLMMKTPYKLHELLEMKQEDVQQLYNNIFEHVKMEYNLDDLKLKKSVKDFLGDKK